MNITSEQADMIQARIKMKANKNHVPVGGFNEPKKKNKYGAKKVNGYDSKIESFMAGLLKIHRINFREKEVWVLQEAFTYMGKKVRTIEMEPDFSIYNTHGALIAIVDTKGVATRDWRIKLKMLKLKMTNDPKIKFGVPVYTPGSQKECQEVVNKLI